MAHPDNAHVPGVAPRRVWRMPVVPEDYDRTPLLCEEERAALRLLDYSGPGRLNPMSHELIEARRAIDRLTRPIADIDALSRRTTGQQLDHARVVVRRLILIHDAPWWAWSEADWFAALCPTNEAFKRRWGTGSHARPLLVDMAYLLGGISDLSPIHHWHRITHMAAGYFGQSLIDQELTRIMDVLAGRNALGYRNTQNTRQVIRSELCRLFVLNRSPFLEDLTVDFLLAHNEGLVGVAMKARASGLHRIMLALRILGLVDSRRPTRSTVTEDLDTSGVPQDWAAWCIACYQRSPGTRHSRRSNAHRALAAGRWLQETHPGITSPEQWDEDLALEYVEVVRHMHGGQYSSTWGRLVLHSKGKKKEATPLQAKTIDAYLGAMRWLFGRLEEVPHAVNGQPARRLTFTFKPSLAFATPSDIRDAMQPNPRDIDMAVWYKLVYAAATLTQDDLPPNTCYPLSFYRAMALIWVTTGRRSDEIRRLRKNCIREDSTPDMLGEDGLPVDTDISECSEPLRYLHVPAGKNRGPFWIWIPVYVYDAVKAWQDERPKHQPALKDRKDGQPADMLFCLKGKGISDHFINRSLIPTLFKKAIGDTETPARKIIAKDARGVITSHRSRSQRATILRMLGVPLDDIATYLGHANSKTVTRYARTHPIALARRIQKASADEAIFEGMMDHSALASGRNPNRWFLGYDADGNPQYCGHPAWHMCPHRLECIKCSAFIGGEKAKLLHDGVDATPIQAKVTMTPLEHAAADGDVALFNELLSTVKDLPPPPPHPDALFNPEALLPTADVSVAAGSAGNRLASWNRELLALTRDLTEAEKEPRGRSVLIASLNKRIASILECMRVEATADTPASEMGS